MGKSLWCRDRAASTIRDPNHPTLKFNVSCKSCSSSLFKFKSVPMARTKCRASTYQRWKQFETIFFLRKIIESTFTKVRKTDRRERERDKIE